MNSSFQISSSMSVLRLLPPFADSMPPIKPAAVLNKLMGELPSIMSVESIPSPPNSFACISGPASAIA